MIPDSSRKFGHASSRQVSAFLSSARLPAGPPARDGSNAVRVASLDIFAARGFERELDVVFH